MGGDILVVMETIMETRVQEVAVAVVLDNLDHLVLTEALVFAQILPVQTTQ
jgi:hypothetical protein